MPRTKRKVAKDATVSVAKKRKKKSTKRSKVVLMDIVNNEDDDNIELKEPAVISRSNNSSSTPIDIGHNIFVCHLCRCRLKGNSNTICQECYDGVIKRIKHTNQQATATNLPIEVREAISCTFEHPHPSVAVSSDFFNELNRVHKCMYDLHEFKGPAFSIPEKYANNRFTVWGIFCSPSCCKSYLMKNHKRNMTMFSLMMTKVYKVHKTIPFASDLELLADPINPLDIQQWRQLAAKDVKVSITHTQEKPFIMQKRNIFSHVLPSHPAFRWIRSWNDIHVQK